MPHASHRLDVNVVLADPDAPLSDDAVAGLIADLRQRGVVADDLGAGPHAEGLVVGGFRRLRVDAPGRVVLYANQQGGFRVRCPETGDNVVPAFQGAVSRWRAGGPRELSCPACGRVHPLEDLVFAPPAAFGRGAVVLADVGAPELTPEAEDLFRSHLGPVRIVLRRPG